MLLLSVSTMAKLIVAAGPAVHAKSGEMLPPVQVLAVGKLPPSMNAELVSLKALVASGMPPESRGPPSVDAPPEPALPAVPPDPPPAPPEPALPALPPDPPVPPPPVALPPEPASPVDPPPVPAPPEDVEVVLAPELPPLPPWPVL